jgi:hypothetical protein
MVNALTVVYQQSMVMLSMDAIILQPNVKPVDHDLVMGVVKYGRINRTGNH